MKTLKESLLSDIEKTIGSVKPYDVACAAIEEFFKTNYNVYGEYTVKKKPDTDGKWIVSVKKRKDFFKLNSTAETITNGLFKMDRCAKFIIENNNNIKNLEGLPDIVGRLDIRNCCNLESIIGCTKSWQPCWGVNETMIVIENCPKLKTLDGLNTSPDSVFLRNCSNLKTLGDCANKFKYIDINACNNLNDIGAMKTAYQLYIHNCTFTSLLSINGLDNVTCERMTVIDCPNMVDVKGLPKKVDDLCLHRDRMPGLNASYPDYSDFVSAIKHESSVGKLNIN